MPSVGQNTDLRSSWSSWLLGLSLQNPTIAESLNRPQSLNSAFKSDSFTTIQHLSIYLMVEKL